MGTKTTDRGIDWDRIQPDDYDKAVATVDAWVRGCNLTHGSEKVTYEQHYKTIGGETICPSRAIYALERAGRKPDTYGGHIDTFGALRTALTNAGPRPKINDYRVREEVAA